MGSDQVINTGGKIDVLSHDGGGIDYSDKSSAHVPSEVVRVCGVSDSSVCDAFVDNVTGGVDPLPITLMRTLDSGFEGQFHAGTQLQITLDAAREVEEHPS